MRERQILFKAPMVRAILEGWKTQTRRVVKPQPVGNADVQFRVAAAVTLDGGKQLHCPYGQPGDRLWVRETHYILDDDRVIYMATPPVDGHWEGGAWRPSIHMPRWASRILLEVTAVRVERLQGISEADAKAEGVYADAACNGMYTADGNTYTTKQDGAAGAYAELWESIHGDASWDANPWVWVVEFKKLGAGETASDERQVYPIPEFLRKHRD